MFDRSMRNKRRLFFAAIKGDKHEALYLLALDSGARQGELWALEWQDVDLEAGVIRIRRTLKDGNDGIEVGPTKGKSERSITVSRSTLTALRSLRWANNSAQLVFPNSEGGYMRRQTSIGEIGSPFWRKRTFPGWGLPFATFVIAVQRCSCGTVRASRA